MQDICCSISNCSPTYNPLLSSSRDGVELNGETFLKNAICRKSSTKVGVATNETKKIEATQCKEGKKQDGKAVIMAEAACMATLTDLMDTSNQATNSSMPMIQFNSFLILI